MTDIPKDDGFIRQKFQRGDVVRVADDLGPAMSHFRSGADAIVMGSYFDSYCGDDSGKKKYTLLFFDGEQHSWYYEHQIAFLRQAYSNEIEGIREARHNLEAQQGDLEWIVANWPEIKDETPGASLETLMRLIGITKPFGWHGDHYIFLRNANNARALLGKALSTGNSDEVRSVAREIVSKCGPYDPATFYEAAIQEWIMKRDEKSSGDDLP